MRQSRFSLWASSSSFWIINIGHRREETFNSGWRITASQGKFVHWSKNWGSFGIVVFHEYIDLTKVTVRFEIARDHILKHFSLHSDVSDSMSSLCKPPNFFLISGIEHMYSKNGLRYSGSQKSGWFGRWAPIDDQIELLSNVNRLSSWRVINKRKRD